MSCLDPRTLLSNKEGNKKKLHNILITLNNAGRILENDCDIVLKEYSNFVSNFNCMDYSTRYKSCCSDCFDPLIDRLDVFYYDLLSQDAKYRQLWNVVKMILLLSHGQATVERGFSINKNLVVENLGHQAIVARRMIKDHIRFLGGIEKVIITKDLIVSAAGAREKYVAFLNEQKKSKEKNRHGEKRKEIEDKISDLKKKQKCLEIDIKGLNETSEEYAEKAEKDCNILLITKSNALRHHAKEKLHELKICETQLTDMYNQLKSF